MFLHILSFVSFILGVVYQFSYLFGGRDPGDAGMAAFSVASAVLFNLWAGKD